MGLMQYYRTTTAVGLKLDPDYKKVYNFAKQNGILLPPIEVVMLQNQLVIDLKELGVFQKWDSFYMGINNFDLGEGYARINWINPSNVIPIIGSNYLNKPGDVTWDKRKGFGGSASGSGDFAWNSLYERVRYTLTDASIFGFCTQEKTVGAGFTLMSGNSTGSSSANGVVFNRLTGPQRINQGNANGSPVIGMTGVGHKVLFRLSDTDLVGYDNLNRQTSSRVVTTIDYNMVAFAVSNNAFVGFGGRGGSFDSETGFYMNLMDQYLLDINEL